MPPELLRGRHGAIRGGDFAGWNCKPVFANTRRLHSIGADAPTPTIASLADPSSRRVHHHGKRGTFVIARCRAGCASRRSVAGESRSSFPQNCLVSFRGSSSRASASRTGDEPRGETFGRTTCSEAARRADPVLQRPACAVSPPAAFHPGIPGNVGVIPDHHLALYYLPDDCHRYSPV